MIVTEYGNEKYKIIIEGLTTEGKDLTAHSPEETVLM